MQAMIKACLTSLLALTSAAGAGAGGLPACLQAILAETCPAEAGAAATERVCHWQHPYRTPQATHRFEDLTGKVRACLGAGAERADDAVVNHPDSYTLRQFDAGTALISISLKDKASLDTTFVFMRIGPGDAR